jgi:hypothetical protein
MEGERGNVLGLGFFKREFLGLGFLLLTLLSELLGFFWDHTYAAQLQVLRLHKSLGKVASVGWYLV